MINSALVALARELLDRADDILVVTHVQPDGDAISSLVATAHALLQLEKRFSLVCDDGLPSRYAFLPMSDLVASAPKTKHRYDLVIALDAADASRMGQAYETLAPPRPDILNIDHHVTNTRFGRVNIIEPEAASTTEVLFQLLPMLGIHLSADLAQCLLTGLVTDTLNFTTASVTSKTMEAAKVLMENGADLYEVSLQALNLRELSTLRIWQAGLNNSRLEDGIIWTAISNEERLRTGHDGSSSFGLGNFMANVREAVMSAVLLEMGDGTVSVGFRSRPPFDVSEIAVALGGGGHSLASGCTVDGPLPRAEALVIDSCKKSIRNQRAVYVQVGDS